METYKVIRTLCTKGQRQEKADDFEISEMFSIGRLHFGCQMSDER